MRLRNVKDKSELQISSFIISNPFLYKNKWKEVFNNNNPIHIEIGMGKGQFIINMAILNPNINFIGIEKYDSVIIRALQKLKEKEINNLKVIRMDAFLIDEVFNNEIETIYLNFSDPWPKEKHEKRRLTSSEFLIKYNNIFKNNCNIILKTDNFNLFEYSKESFKNNGYEFININYNLNDLNNVTTEYEDKFRKLNKKIYKIEVLKCK